jgi:Glycosyltransferase family 87
VLVFQRRWRAVIALAASALALCALGALIFGTEAYWHWMTTLGRVGWWWLPMNGSWHGFVSRVLEGGKSVAPVVHAESLVRPLALIGGVLIALGTIGVAGSRDLSARDPDRSMLVALIGAILASPLGWVYYLPLAYGPLVGWLGATRGWDRVRRLRWREGALLLSGIALLYVPQEVAASGQPSALATITLASVYFWSLLMLWVFWTTARP